MSFTLICNECENKITLEDGFERVEKEIVINTYMLCDITCRCCNNRVDESEDN